VLRRDLLPASETAAPRPPATGVRTRGGCVTELSPIERSSDRNDEGSYLSDKREGGPISSAGPGGGH